MQFGVCLPNFPFGVRPSREAILEVAQEAEALGYDSVWTSDHLLVPRERPRYGRLFEALTTLAYVGGATRKLQLGTSVLILPYRNAIIVAKQAATIDALTGGRLILGVGAGWIEEEFQNLGAGFRTRGRHLDEGLAVMQALWSEENPAVHGEFYQFSNALFEPRPVQPQGIPIWVGGHSEAAMRRAVRFGAAWHPDDLPTAQLAPAVAKLREMSAGREPGVALRRTVDLRPAMALAARAGGETAGRWPGGSASALTGSLEEIAAAMAEVAQLDIEHLICQIEHQTQAEHVAQMRFLARELLPRFNK